MNIDPAVQVANANYDRVLYFIDKALSENPGFCKCKRCRLDTAAMALNTLPPHYFVNPSHSKTYDLGSPWILIEMAVRDALERVNMFPHHEPMALGDTQRPTIPLDEIGA